MANEIVVIGDKSYSISLSSDIIEAESKTGIKSWRGYVVVDDQGRHYLTSSWYNVNKKTGNRSVTQWAEPYYAEPKNIGRSNETTNSSQAEFEFRSMVQKEKDKRNAEKPLPMLAQPFGKREAKIAYPAFVQPKFDGMRVLYDGTDAWSRGNKPIIEAVFAHLHFDTQGQIIDGELLLPNNPKVNETMSAAKKFRAGISDQLVYRVYDIVDPNMTFETRFALLHKIVSACGNANVVLAETHVVSNRGEIVSWHEDFTSRGFEGSIIRNRDGLYAINKRSDDLQKYKDFVDEEFEIVDVIPAGGGSSLNVGKFVCRAKNGELFESTATGTEEERREYLTNKAKYVGQFAKVKYRELTAYGVPFHSNVLEIRETANTGF
jgi:ATP-dependent DNA ligase